MYIHVIGNKFICHLSFVLSVSTDPYNNGTIKQYPIHTTQLNK